MEDMMAVCEGPDCNAEFIRFPINKKYHSQDCKRNAENAAKRRQMVQDLAAAVTPVYMDDTPDSVSQLEYLRKENRRLVAATEKYKNAKYEFVDSVYQATRDALLSLDYKPVSPPRLPSGPGEEEVAVTPIADLQLGKVTPTYNSEVCAERMELYAEKVLRLTEIQRLDHPVNDLRIWLLGDIVEGENIFTTQASLLDRSLYAQVAKDGPQILGDFMRRMLGNFHRIHVTGVIGNHGVLKSDGKKDYNNETNMDRMLYKIMEHIFAAEDRITFNIPDGFGERSFYAVDTIGKYRTLLVHGDQFPAPTTSHAYYRKVLGWKAGGISEEFDDCIMGHWHQVVRYSFGKTVVRIVGSPESTNTYASEALGVMSRPSQLLHFVHPEHGVVTEHQIYLD